jgi:glycosyltransferase involved in cell wall biosynthesis
MGKSKIINMKTSIVSVIITTRNEERNIKNCLESITQQSYKSIEILVVDNGSTDKTKEIAQKYTKNVLNIGPERSAQRNFGAKKSKGEYLLFLDADMILTEQVIKECIKTIKSSKVGGIIIPEQSFGEGFWASAKALERSFYIGDDFIEAARFFPKKVFEEVKGFDLNLTGPEDWDLSQRVKIQFGLARIKSLIKHNEGKLSLRTTLKKKYYYSKKISEYKQKSIHTKTTSVQLNPFHRYRLFFSKPTKIYQDPVLFLGMLFMKTAEMFVGFIGMYIKR